MFSTLILGDGWTSKENTECICFALGSRSGRSWVLVGRVEIDARHWSRLTRLSLQLWMTKISCVRTCSKRVRKHVRSRIRRPNVGSSRLGEKSRSTTKRTFLFAVGASFACPRGRQTFLTEPRNPDQSAIKKEIAADYCFLRDVSGGPSQPVLMGRDRRTGMFFAHAVPYKGAGVERVAQQMARDISKCGYHGRVVLRSDQEPASQDLMEEVARLHGDLPTVLEASPVSGFAARPGDQSSDGLG